MCVADHYISRRDRYSQSHRQVKSNLKPQRYLSEAVLRDIQRALLYQGCESPWRAQRFMRVSTRLVTIWMQSHTFRSYRWYVRVVLLHTADLFTLEYFDNRSMTCRTLHCTSCMSPAGHSVLFRRRTAVDWRDRSTSHSYASFRSATCKYSVLCASSLHLDESCIVAARRILCSKASSAAILALTRLVLS